MPFYCECHTGNLEICIGIIHRYVFRHCQKNSVYIYTWEDLLNEFSLISRVKFSMNLIIIILYRFMYKIKSILPRRQYFYTSHVNMRHRYLIIFRAYILHKIFINAILTAISRNSVKSFIPFFTYFTKNMTFFTLPMHRRDVISVPLVIAWQNLNLEYSIIPPSWHSCMYVCTCTCTYVLQSARVSTTYHSKAELKEGSINDAVVSLEPLHADV